MYQKQENKHFFCLYQRILFCTTKNITLNSTHYFITKIPKRQKFQQIAINYLSDNDFKDFMKLYKNAQEKHILS